MFGVPSEEIVGIAAGVLTSASMLPQVIKMIQEKQASQVSVVMILVLIAGISLWIWYGAMKNDKPIVYTNCFSLLVNLLMGYFKFRYKDNKPQ